MKAAGCLAAISHKSGRLYRVSFMAAEGKPAAYTLLAAGT